MSEEFKPYSPTAGRICDEVISLAGHKAPHQEKERRRRIIELNIELVRERMAVMREPAPIERAGRTIANLEGQL